MNEVVVCVFDPYLNMHRTSPPVIAGFSNVIAGMPKPDDGMGVWPIKNIVIK